MVVFATHKKDGDDLNDLGMVRKLSGKILRNLMELT
jgi:hypothetical protein